MEIVWQSHGMPSKKRTAAACSTCRSRKKRCYHLEDCGAKERQERTETETLVEPHSEQADGVTSSSPARISEYNPESVLAGLAEDAESRSSGSRLDACPRAAQSVSQASVHHSEAQRRLLWYQRHKTRTVPRKISESYRKYLEDEGAFAPLPRTTTDALLPLYVSVLDDLTPILNGASVFRDHSNGHASVYLVKAISLVVCKCKQAAPFLRLSDTGPLLEPLDFASTLLAGLDAAIKADLEPSRVTKVQILALMHLHNDGLAGADRASSYLSQAICEAFSMCIHLKIPDNPEKDQCDYLWWTLRNFDRLGKPIMATGPFFIDDADIGVQRISPRNDDYRSQVMGVALVFGDLMTMATRGYKASISEAGVRDCQEFPSLVELTSGTEFHQFHKAHQGKLLPGGEQIIAHIASLFGDVVSCRCDAVLSLQWPRHRAIHPAGQICGAGARHCFARRMR
jgi:hypothetical protein